MSRYIDADELKARKQLDSKTYRYYIKIEDVYSAPHIDIVRCKECKRANHELSGIYCGLSDVIMGEDGYCSIGEREDKEITTDCSWK